MSHHTAKDGYHQLLHRLNKFPQGAPPSELLFKIFSILFSQQEATLLSLLPLTPFSAQKAAAIWKISEAPARNRLEAFADRGVLLDLERNGRTLFFLPPPMAGFFEFSLMRLRVDIDQKELAGHFYRYINQEEDFVRDLFGRGGTSIGRILVNEPALPAEEGSQVLDYERASEVIRSASHIAVGLCYCRHKMTHVNRACSAPLDNCMTLNAAARSLILHGIARKIDAAKGLELLDQAQALNLVQCADNVQRDVNFLCHCCGCCCEAMLAIRRLAIPNVVCTTNFIQHTDAASCTGCGRCAAICPVEAITLAEQAGEAGEMRRKAQLEEKICLGCGVCVRNCPAGAIRLDARAQRVMTPISTAHRVVLMALERGKLQNLIFDNQAYLSHRTLATILGAILRLPPLKRALANRQLKSRYLERVIADLDIDTFSS
jgi:ferredoxin